RGVIIDGAAAAAGSPCLVTSSNSNVIRGLQVARCRAGVVVNGSGNVIGPDNAFYDNYEYGIQLSGSGNIVKGNKIGTNVEGTALHPAGTNLLGGVSVEGTNHVIGGGTPGDRNVISGNGVGIQISNNSTGSFIKGNYIGTDVGGTMDLGNTTVGVNVVTSQTTIGGAAAGEGNVISGNGGAGIRLFFPGPSGSVVQGNRIGTTADGLAPLGNGEDGIFLDRSLENMIGGTAAGAGNEISANGQSGIDVTFNSDNTTIQGNFIGTEGDGTGALGNLAEGIKISGSDTNTIGGTSGNAGNRIANNVGDGIFVQSSTGNLIRDNSVVANGGLGIDLFPDGPTANDAAPDNDSGANTLQNFPVLSSATREPGGLRVQGTLTSSTSASFTVELFGSA
ncbi:MAG: right-handed parallel beta-helix repeat-containing protein, partial [Gammaproteobacteria bacterium]